MRPYECHFGFRESPFSLTPDPQFFYPTPAYREAYATLRYGIQARKGFVLITGEAGTGKTTLLRMLMEQADSNIRTAFIANPPGSFTELLRVIMNDLELPEPSNDRVVVTEQFNAYLLDQLRQDHIVSLLVDEAQNLNPQMLEELRLLSNFETHKEKLIQIVLVGQPELGQKLEKPELRQLTQRVALRCLLRPLAAEDIGPYIEFRLAVAGYRGRDLFDPDSIPKIVLCTHGVPRLINALCDNALLRACDREVGKVSAEIIDEAARDLWLHEPQPAVLRNSDSGISPADAMLVGTAPGKGSVTIALDEGMAASHQSIPVLRKRMSVKVLGMGLWWVIITVFAIASAKSYISSTEQPLAPVVDDTPESFRSRLKDTDQKWVLVPPPRIIAAADKRGGIETPGLQLRDPFKTDLKRDSAAGAPNHEKIPRSATRVKGQRSLGVFNVVGSSFVREKPTADAEITGTLEPGTKVQVVGKTREYLQVRALDKQKLSGFVHLQDAFFEPEFRSRKW